MTIREALQAKYSLPHWVLLFEVRDSTGFDSSRSADAIAIGLYRSRGREIHGFEIKEQRADWLKELKNPAKAEAVGRFCDYFWLVTPESGVARLEELPNTWGWLALKKERFAVAKKPEKIHCAPCDREMLCSLVYATKERFIQEANRSIDKIVTERLTQELKSRRETSDYYKHEVEKLNKRVRSFEQASGLSIETGWNDSQTKIGEAVKRVLAMQRGELGNFAKAKQELAFTIDRCKALVASAEKELLEYEAIESQNGANNGQRNPHQ